MSVSPFHLNTTILISYIHRNVKVRQPVKIKVLFFEDSAAEIFVQKNVHTTTTTTTTKIMKSYFFKEWSHNISNKF